MNENQAENLTIVTGLWDIARAGRDFSIYREHFDKFLKIPCPMVLFVPKDLEAFVRERRSEKILYIRVYELDDIKNIMFNPFGKMLKRSGQAKSGCILLESMVGYQIALKQVMNGTTLL